jgi:Predicted metalloendopeptidase
MKQNLVRALSAAIAVMLGLSALSATTTDPATESATSSANDKKAATPAKKPASSIPAARPRVQDDFYTNVNYDWLRTAKIPTDSPVSGGFNDLSRDIEKKLIDDLDKGLENSLNKRNDTNGQMYKFYKLALDDGQRNKNGVKPILPMLKEIEDIENLEALNRSITSLYDSGTVPMPFSFYVATDMKDATKYTVYLNESGTILPDKSYYAKDNQAGQQLLKFYSEILEHILVTSGKSKKSAAKIAKDTLAVDARIATYVKSGEEASEYTKMYNPVSRADFEKKYNGVFDILTVMDAKLPKKPEQIVVSNLDYFEHLKEIVGKDFEQYRNWLYAQSLFGLAPYLSEEYRYPVGQYTLALTGADELPSSKKYAFQLTDSLFSQVLGQLYAEKHLDKNTKANVEKMVDNMIEVYEKQLQNNEWMNAETKKKAIQKLNSLEVKIAYPDKIPEFYSRIRIDEKKSLVENIIAASKAATNANYAKLSQPIDRSEWQMSPQTVNAMYSPLSHDITFPAAILQAPFYDSEQSASANYGGIGAIIAHEISHAFDTNGSKYDEKGNLADWWTEADYAEFEKRTQAMIDQFDAEKYNDQAVNGKLTISENVADSAGLNCALEVVKGLPNPNMKEFFASWATVWRQKARPEYEALLLSVDVHAPNKLRANVQASNLDEFYETFDIKEGDAMWRAPEKRVKIW